MTSYRFGDVVLVPFPFSDGVGIKKRPAVIVSPLAYQQARPDAILMAITSRIRDPMGYGEALLHDWPAAGLLKPSLLKPLLFTLEQSGIARQLGALTEDDRHRLDFTLTQIIQQGMAP